MKTGIFPGTAKASKNLAQQVARHMGQEPYEVLKQARGQLTGEQFDDYRERISQESEEEKRVDQTQELKNKDQVQSSRSLQALESELADIRRDKLFKELQRRIAEGAEVYLEKITELTPEQKQVLKAQMEAVRQRQGTRDKGQDPLVEPKTKTPRGSWLFGGKLQAERQRTRVERPLPPSG